MPATKTVTARQFVLVALASAAAALFVVGVVGWIRGYRAYVVHTGSMEPTLVPGDVVVDRPARNVHPGEIITVAMRSGPDSVVTHRVASVSGGIVKTKGDANRSVDPWSARATQVVGTETLIVPRFGYLLVYLQQPAGLASIATSLLSLLLLWQLFFPPRTDDGMGRIRARGRRAGRHRIPAPTPAPVTRRRAAQPAASATSLLAGELEFFTVLSGPSR